MATVAKRLRFEILRRDGHACHYCGRTPPDVKLTVDAVVPEVLGGSHKDPTNLVTACGDCNGGKTSSSPDAPLVAAVAEDAARWDAARQTVAEEMRAEAAVGLQSCETFDKIWTEHLGDCRRPDDWARSIQTFIKYGLPMEVLQECVIKAAGSKAPHHAKWRYMCKVAWARLGEIRERAAAVCGVEPPGSDVAATARTEGRLSLARELLDEMTEEERAYYLDHADYGEYAEEPLTEDEIASGAVSIALNDARCDLAYLCKCVKGTLSDLPEGVGARALNVPADRIHNFGSPQGNEMFRLIEAMNRAGDYLRLPAAKQLLDALPAQEQAEWLAYAHALCDRAKGLDEDRWLVRAAACAQVIKDGRYYPVMCEGPGKYVPFCPAKGTFNARVGDWNCCGPEGPAEHEGHRFCSAHAEQLVDGTLVIGDRALVAADLNAVPTEDEVPF